MILFKKTSRLFLVAFFALTGVVNACDVCSCYMGITPNDNKGFVGIMYRYRSFNGYPIMNQSSSVFPGSPIVNNTSSGSPFQNNLKYGFNTPSAQLMHDMGSAGATAPVYSTSDYELFQSVDLRFKYFYKEKIEFNLIAPLAINTSSIAGHFFRLTSIGDITLSSGYHLIRKFDCEGFKQRLVLGAGIKLPTGENSFDDNGTRYFMLNQPGTGSWDYFPYLNYTCLYKRVGLNLYSLYRVNGQNKFNERISNSTSLFINLFMRFPVNDSFTINPAIQSSFEQTNGLYINNIYQFGTRTNNLLIGPGLDMFYKNFSFNSSFQLPLHNASDPADMALAGWFMFGLNYHFL